jgi:hypothetical protein
MKMQIRALLLAALLGLGGWAQPAWALEAKDHDAFFLAAGTANISVKDSDSLLSGSAIWGGFRIGIFSFLFVELGFGTVGYSDTVSINGVPKNIDFRTTGANYGIGLVIPIRELRLGARFQRNPNNKWAEEISDVDTDTTDSNVSGDIDYDSVSAFGQFLDGGLEVGMRRDIIRETDSILENSFGVYVMVNFKVG